MSISVQEYRPTYKMYIFFCIFQDKNIIFSVPSTKSNDSDLSRRDPAILETLMKMLPPSSKVKEYLKHSMPTGLTPPSAPRPTSATAAMSGKGGGGLQFQGHHNVILSNGKVFHLPIFNFRYTQKGC